MKLQKTYFEGLYEIFPSLIHDDRGYFLETFRATLLEEAGLVSNFIQDNQSFSLKNVVRGLHLQMPPHEQVKLVRVPYGKVLDVVVDLRKGSKTFGKYYKCILDDEKGNMLYIPAGFAHGFAVLENAVFSYKCSGYYNKESETGIVYNDPDIGIDWEIKDPILSEKDKLLITFKEFNIKYGSN